LDIASRTVVVLRSEIKFPAAPCRDHLIGIPLPSVAVPEKLGAEKAPAAVSGEMNPANTYVTVSWTEDVPELPAKFSSPE
jgi:hypothetical protein